MSTTTTGAGTQLLDRQTPARGPREQHLSTTSHSQEPAP